MDDNKKIIEIEKKNNRLNDKANRIEGKESDKNNHLQEKSKRKYMKLRTLAKKRKQKKEREVLLRPIREEQRQKREYLRSLSNPPQRPVIQEVGNSITHGVGALFAVVGFILLLMKSNTPLQYLSSIVYGVCMFVMMLMSCLYHAFKSGSKVKRIWRRFDYSSIYLLIGGTFAPIYLVYWGNTLGIVLFIIQWVLIAIGITFVCVFGPGRFRPLHYTMYFAIGWSGLIFIPDFIRNNLNLMYMILAGGLVYTFGMIPFAMKNVKSAHFIWHFFVLVAAIVHYLGILFFIY